MKLKRGDALVVASHNKGKLREIEELLAPFGFTVQAARRNWVSPNRKRPASPSRTTRS